MLVPHDAVNEGYKKPPRKGEWCDHDGYIVLRCPVCEKCCALSRHQISSDGGVYPQWVCPSTREDLTPCTFTESLRLGGYEEYVRRCLPF